MFQVEEKMYMKEADVTEIFEEDVTNNKHLC
jgi:hypothetical protein